MQASTLTPPVLKRLSRGIEKESLRVRADGTLAQTPHPAGLGSPLTHRRITTDFSESQLELVTSVHVDIDACLAELTELHQLVYREIGEELLWCASMPCELPDDAQIPIGRYGSSNIGRMKTVYRQGLVHRYGPRMQTISGIHYNFSLPEEAWPLLAAEDGIAEPTRDYRDGRYLALIRNFRRHSWLLLLLLGASPAACECFVRGYDHALSTWDEGTVSGPYATSLRMGRLGYQSDAQSSILVSFNSLSDYAAALVRALTTQYAPYERTGVREGNEYRQLASTMLQIENEFYGTIRPKRSIRRGERTLRALMDRGVEYVEVRLLDIDPFSPVGIDAQTCRLLDVFLLHCLLSPSPPDSQAEAEAISRNKRLVAEAGRDSRIRLERGGERIAPVDWGREVLHECIPVAAALDEAHGGRLYTEALETSRRGLDDFSLLPSPRVLREVEHVHARSYRDFVLAQSRGHRDRILSLPLAGEAKARLASEAAESLAAQRRLEAEDDVPFETYRQRYLAQITAPEVDRLNYLK